MRWLRLLIGAATLAAGALGGVYLWSLLGGAADDEMTFRLRFASAEGLARGAYVKYRGVRVGEVRTIDLARGGASVDVLCAMKPAARATLAKNTRFWVVRPRFRGLTEGASGLDTLIKDSYITYDTPAGPTEPLPEGAIVEGLAAPPPSADDDTRVAILPQRPGDLELTVLFPESGGLRPGSDVRSRGLPVGIVTAVDLDAGQRAVVVRARIRREHRSGVTDTTIFWVARPRVSADLTGIDVEDIETILGGAHLSYATPADERGSPASDDSSFVGAGSPPELEWRPPSSDELATARSVDTGGHLGDALVKVHYSCSERDWLSPDDSFAETSPGLLFRSADGQAQVLVARSGVDGAWVLDDVAGEAEVENELWRVTLSDGSVFSARLAWRADGDADLALLTVEGLAAPSTTAPIGFEETDADSALVVIGLNGFHGRATLQSDGALSGIDARGARGLVLRDRIAVGVAGIGAEETPDALRMARFTLLPASLRPTAPQRP